MRIDAMLDESIKRAVDMSPTQSAEGLAARCGKLTASNMKRALNFLKNGNPSKDRTDYQFEILAERLTQLNIRHYVNPAMEWGSLTEPEAKVAYTAISGNPLHPSGFYDHPEIDMFGATPDAEMGRDGLAEFKCPTTQTFIGWKMAGVIPEEHIPQMLAQLACTGRKWVEFVAFDPRIKAKPEQQIFIRRFMPKPEEIQAIEQAAIKFLDEVQAMWEAFHS